MTVRDFDRILGRDSIFEFMAKSLVYDYTDTAVSENPDYENWSGVQLSAASSTALFVLNEMGYSHVRDAPGNHGLYLWLLESNRSDMPHIIAFRGSEEKFDGHGLTDDWQADLIDIDVGFRQIYGLNGEGNNIDLLQEFYDQAVTLDDFGNKGLCITGHSLGGALAQMFASDSRWWTNVKEVVTFQSPGVGSSRLQHWQTYTGSEANVRHHISAGDFVHMTGGVHLQNDAGSFYYHLHNSLSLGDTHCVTLLCTNPVHTVYPINGDLPTEDADSGFNIMPAYGSILTQLRTESLAHNPDSVAWTQLLPYDGASDGTLGPDPLIDAICSTIQAMQTADGRREREPLLLSTESEYSYLDQIMCGHISIFGLDAHIPVIGIALHNSAEVMRSAFGTLTTASEGAWDGLETRVEQSGSKLQFVVDLVVNPLNISLLGASMTYGAYSKVRTRSVSREIEMAADILRAQQAATGGGL